MRIKKTLTAVMMNGIGFTSELFNKSGQIKWTSRQLRKELRADHAYRNGAIADQGDRGNIRTSGCHTSMNQRVIEQSPGASQTAHQNTNTAEEIQHGSQGANLAPYCHKSRDDIELQDVFEVDAILDHRGSVKKTEFLIRWKGYGSKHDTWEPRSNILDKTLVDNYEQCTSHHHNRNRNVIWSHRSQGRAKKARLCFLRNCDCRTQASVRRVAGPWGHMPGTPGSGCCCARCHGWYFSGQKCHGLWQHPHF